jgi:hypothetical protein
MDTLEERIATLALHTFDDLPTKSKPRIYPDGSREWVPMSAVVLVRGIFWNLITAIEWIDRLISRQCRRRFSL